MSVKIIGICGGSCSGKTTLLNLLKQKNLTSITYLSFDEYFVGMTKLKNRKINDWENPDLYRYSDYEEDLSKLKAGITINVKCHSRESAEKGIKSIKIIPKGIVIIEGFLIAITTKARKQFDSLIFLDIPEQEMIKRRVARIKTNQGWDSVEYIHNKLIPGFKKYVLPQKRYADLIMDGMSPTDTLMRDLIAFVDPI